jgi:predicted alpha/beta superfamily hydrolase
MKLFLLLFAMFTSSLLAAQHKLEIEVTVPEPRAGLSAIYIAGNFNGWNPKDENFRLMERNGKFYLSLQNIPAGDYEYKFTRGGWETVETDAKGMQISNRLLKLGADTTLRIAIAGWASGSNKPVAHTASRNVRIMDTAFYMPQLKRHRRIWVYLPAGYFIGNKRFPVLYMHDGQNLFDNATSFSGEWGVDEVLDSMKKQCIVIGIDNGGLTRMNEYNPYDNERFGKGEGKQYIEFIAKTLKPLVDKKYRTLSDKKNTMIAGSSMGGLISMYAVVKHPGVFGTAGVFSPSFWIAPQLPKDIQAMVKASTHRSNKIYFYAGEQESKELVKAVLSVFEHMRKLAGPKMEVRINAEGQHNEATWRQEFPAFYNWSLK